MTGEESLKGGNASGEVSRVGDTVRKPWLPTTGQVVEFMAAVRAAGVDVPRTHGRDDQGRLVLDYVPGTMAMEVAPLTDDVVHRVGTLVRAIHDAATPWGVPDDWPDGPLPAPRRELVCHNDLATWNLVIDGDRLVFIDWDGAAPSSRVWDLAYAAISFAPLFPGADVAACGRRITALLAGYDANPQLRLALPAALTQRSQAMYDLLRESHTKTGLQPWASMYVEGHGEHWRDTTEFIAHHHQMWVEAARR